MIQTERSFACSAHGGQISPIGTHGKSAPNRTKQTTIAERNGHHVKGSAVGTICLIVFAPGVRPLRGKNVSPQYPTTSTSVVGKMCGLLARHTTCNGCCGTASNRFAMWCLPKSFFILQHCLSWLL